MTNINYQPHKLLIENIKIFEDAAPIIDEIEEKIYEEINSVIEKWVGSQEENSWEGTYLGLDDYTYFYPRRWKSEEEDGDLLSYFYLYVDKRENRYYITSLCGLDKNKSYIVWLFNLSLAKNKKNKTQWKEFLNKEFNRYQADFIKHGVELSEDKAELFMPFKFDQKLLEKGYPDDLSEALEPLEVALQKLKELLPIFEAIRQKASE